MADRSLETRCCIVGGGPAGVMLGFLLARAGVPVTVLEKHKDFFRDFRGDTIHPSTLELMHELGLLEAFLQLPHQEIRSLKLVLGGEEYPFADFTHVPTHAKFLGLLPQWDFLNFIAAEGRKLPGFELLVEHEVTELIFDGGVVTGVRARTPEGFVNVLAPLVVACDGRHSTARESAHLALVDDGAPIDVLWFRLSHHAGDPDNALLLFNEGHGLFLINRSDYFQSGLIVAKDSFASTIQPAGLEAFRATLAGLAPFFADRTQEITSWEQVKLLSVQINRLKRWHRPGLLCIGDAAHAMSPVGGVGINLAIQDAVAAARILAPALQDGSVTASVLARVQARREFPARATQFAQKLAHRFLAAHLGRPGRVRAPWLLRVLSRFAWFRRMTARFVGVGVRPEHVRGRIGNAPG